MLKDIVSFVKQKDFKLIKELGRGGLGKTVLLFDSEMAEQFVCKKYAPYDDAIKDDYYEYFKNEIKVMYRVNHPNVVRIFNYYLYPEFKTGYILMEFIEGKNISEYLIENPSKIDYVFQQVIEAFQYLESNHILHRDIRNENLLISVDGQAKVIDFGFGKQIYSESDKGKSISLNWWCEVPRDFDTGIYDSKTEIYFVGKLFEAILSEAVNEPFSFPFSYRHILERMVRLAPSERAQSFGEIKGQLIEQSTSFDEMFSFDERKAYKSFADSLISAIASIDEAAKYNNDMTRAVASLEQLYKTNVLEDEIHNTNDLIRIFVSGSFRFYNKPILSTYVLRDIIQILKKSNSEKRDIFLLNIQNRLNRIHRTSAPNADDIPF